MPRQGDMNLIQNSKTMLSLLSLLLLSAYFIYFESQNDSNPAGQPLPAESDYAESDYTVNLPLVFFSSFRVPGFVPPNVESSPYLVPVTLPACDEEALIIDDTSDLGQVDWQAYDVFCLLPGDYTTWGDLLIEDVNGTAVQPKVLRYYDPANANPPHPVVRADSSGQEAVLLQFELKRSNYWIIDGITIRNSPDDNRVSDSSNNIFNRILVEGGDGHLLRIERDSDNNVVQNSVLRNQSAAALQNDQVCLILYTQDWDHIGLEIENTRIIHNEIYDCAAGIALLKAPAERPAYYPGTIVANNDIYISNKLYTDCLGNPDPNGACACAENGIDVKATIQDEDLMSSETWVRIINNNMWGFRHTDDTLDGQGNRMCATGEQGPAIRSHDASQSLVIQGNIIMNSAVGIGGSGAETSDPPLSSHFMVNNLIYNIHDCYDPDKQGLKQFNIQDQGHFVGCFDENDEITRDHGKGFSMSENEDGPKHYGNTHFGNSLIDIGDIVNLSGWWAFILDADHSFVCNTMINAAGKDYFTWHETNLADKNAYYNSVPYCPMSSPCEDQHLIDEPTAEAAMQAPFTFSRMQWTGPALFTIPDAIHTSATPAFDAGAVCWVNDPNHPWN